MLGPDHQHEIVELESPAPRDLGCCVSCEGDAEIACAVQGCNFMACRGCMTPDREPPDEGEDDGPLTFAQRVEVEARDTGRDRQ